LKNTLVVSLIVIAVLLALFVFSYIQNNALSVTTYLVASEKLPSAFNGYRIVQLSDLHGKAFGARQQRLLRAIRRQKPDLIVFTGDMIANDTPGNRSRSLTLMRGLAQLAPVYWVTGNHDRVAAITAIERALTAAGVNVLANRGVPITRSGSRIWLSGIDDPSFGSAAASKDTERIVNETMDRSLDERTKGMFSLLLAHRPELLPYYARKGFDLVFTGHAHGGQVRLPGIGPLYAPGQGFLPKLAEGLHRESGTAMIVNRGLGNSDFPQRLFNRPEIVVVTLAASQ
jgi:predicted MPP superfamily phosphohydrolase